MDSQFRQCFTLITLFLLLRLQPSIHCWFWTLQLFSSYQFGNYLNFKICIFGFKCSNLVVGSNPFFGTAVTQSIKIKVKEILYNFYLNPRFPSPLPFLGIVLKNGCLLMFMCCPPISFYVCHVIEFCCFFLMKIFIGKNTQNLQVQRTGIWHSFCDIALPSIPIFTAKIDFNGHIKWGGTYKVEMSIYLYKKLYLKLSVCANQFVLIKNLKGGQMAELTMAANDPIFYMMHSFADMVFIFYPS